jgi:uncharacterized membrane protein
MSLTQKLINLWLVIVAGFIIHNMLNILPLFFDQSIAAEGADAAQIAGATWMMLVFFTLPLLMVLLIQMCNPNRIKYVNMVVAGLFLLLNVTHPMELIGQEPFAWHQLILMVFIAIVNIALAYLSWKWLREKANQES